MDSSNAEQKKAALSMEHNRLHDHFSYLRAHLAFHDQLESLAANDPALVDFREPRYRHGLSSAVDASWL